MSLISVDHETCIKCGACVEVCPTSVLLMSEEGPKDLLKSERGCIACGHCVAVCPNRSLDNLKSPLNDMIETDSSFDFNFRDSENFLRSRRSIRVYKKEKVPKESLEKLLNIARFAPTASNSQSISYIVFSDVADLNKIVELVIDWMRYMAKNVGDEGRYNSKVFSNFVHTYEKTAKDIVLRGAPHLVIALAPKSFERARENACFSLSYLELAAPSLGLGSCWAGFVEVAAKTYEPLMEFLDIPEDKVFSAAVMIGYPKYEYHRFPERNALDLEWR